MALWYLSNGLADCFPDDGSLLHDAVLVCLEIPTMLVDVDEIDPASSKPRLNVKHPAWQNVMVPNMLLRKSRTSEASHDTCMCAAALL